MESWHNRRMMLQRIERFVADPSSEGFAALALDAFAFQYERIEPYRRLADRRGARPGELDDWRQIPPTPTSAFKTVELAAAPEREVFRSSGTGGGDRSVHHHPYPELYRRVIDASFPAFCLPRGESPPMLSLVASRRDLPDSSLAFMVDHVLRRFGAPDSLEALGKRRLEAAAARSWLGARQRDGRPCLVLATAFALVELLDALDRLGLRFRLPAGSAVFETGGFKGRTREVSPAELAELVGERLGVPPEAIVREYGMTELTSQCYTRSLLGGDPHRFVAPHWVRVRIVDPATLEEVPAGETGLVAVLDLANLGSAVHLLTEDLGRAEGEGFRLLGRASGAELRGCSLAVEEMAG